MVEMWHRRMELEVLLPIISIFSNSHPMWKELRNQVPEWADECRRHVNDILPWLDDELKDRPFIAGNDYTVADIAAQ